MGNRHRRAPAPTRPAFINDAEPSGSSARPSPVATTSTGSASEPGALRGPPARDRRGRPGPRDRPSTTPPPGIGTFSPTEYVAAVATCMAAQPACKGAPPAGFGELCGTECGAGTVQCDGTCNAFEGHPQKGDSCVYAQCSCGDIEGQIDCNGECKPVGIITRCCLLCGSYCSPF